MGLSRRSVAFVVCVLVMCPLGACSKDSKKPAVAAASSSASSSRPASSAPLSTTTTTDVTGCNATPPPVSAINVSHVDSDFNGDGKADTLTVYGTGTVQQPSPYHLQIQLSGSLGAVDDVIADAATDNSQVVKALGGADVTASAGLPPDGSGAEAFIQVGSGASDALVGVFQLIGCKITRLTGPSLFPIGGSVTHLDGLRCDGTAGGVRLVQLSATSNDGVSYDATESRLQVQNAAFIPLGDPITTTVEASDPRLQGFSSLSCPGVLSP